MSTRQLTSTQTQVLQHAVDHNSGRIDWFPDSVKGGARRKVIESLFKHALVTPLGQDWFVAAEGYEALGMPHRAPITLAALDAVIAHAEAAQHGASQVLADEVDGGDPTEAEIAVSNEIDPATQPKTPRTRDNSKQATVISMLKRPEGATIKQICEATHWQAHTTRGTFAGAFKKKLGLTITSTKDAGGDRVYRIV